MLLVTGITGHSGRFFLEELIKNKYENPIRCIIRETSETSSLDNCGLSIEKVIGDIKNEEFLNKCMKGIDTVFHIVSIRYTLNVVRAAINNKIKKVICVHTTGIFSRFKAASQEYRIIENKLQEMIKGREIKIIVLRPTMIYGDFCDHNISRFIKMVDRLRFFPVINHGKCLIQPVNARDLGKAYYDVLMISDEKLSSAYNLSGEKPIPIIDVLKLISGCLGKKTFFINIPSWLGILLASSLKIATLGRIDYIEKVQRMSEDRSFSHEDARKDFGYSCVPFEIGIAREVKEYLNML